MVAVGVAAPGFRRLARRSVPYVVAGASVQVPRLGRQQLQLQGGAGGHHRRQRQLDVPHRTWTFDGITGPIPADITLAGGDGNLVLLINRDNSAANHTVAVTYQATNLTTNEVVNGIIPATELTFAPNCASPLTCP